MLELCFFKKRQKVVISQKLLNIAKTLNDNMTLKLFKKTRLNVCYLIRRYISMC